MVGGQNGGPMKKVASNWLIGVDMKLVALARELLPGWEEDPHEQPGGTRGVTFHGKGFYHPVVFVLPDTTEEELRSCIACAKNEYARKVGAA